jgi:hypothetical protein
MISIAESRYFVLILVGLVLGLLLVSCEQSNQVLEVPPDPFSFSQEKGSRPSYGQISRMTWQKVPTA